MPDDLKAIVQRMVDAGESEDNIATVIQHFARPTVPDAQADRPITVKDRQAQAWNFALPQPSAQHEPDTFWGGFGQSLKDQVLGATVGNPMLQGAAHPTSAGDLLSLVLPTAGHGETSVPSLARGALRIMQRGGRAAADGPTMSAPVRFMRGAMAELNRPLSVESYAPNISSGPSSSGAFGASASDVPTLRQGTYTLLPDGSYGVKAMGGPLQTGETVHVMNRAGNGQLHTINAVTDDGVGLLTSQTAEPLYVGGQKITDPSILALLRKRLSGQP